MLLKREKHIQSVFTFLTKLNGMLIFSIMFNTVFSSLYRIINSLKLYFELYPDRRLSSVSLNGDLINFRVNRLILMLDIENLFLSTLQN